MGFFDAIKDVAGKIGDSVEKGVQTASDSSKKMAEKMRLKKEMNQLESEIIAAYTDIGRKYFELHANDPEEAYSDKIFEINEKKSKSVSLKAELDALEDKVPCPNCNAYVSKGQKFCDKCGANVESVTNPAPAASGKICPKCSAPVAEGQKFCEKCGADIEAGTATAAPANDTRVCKKCGAAVGANQKFCEKCGDDIEKQYAETVDAEVVNLKK